MMAAELAVGAEELDLRLVPPLVELAAPPRVAVGLERRLPLRVEEVPLHGEVVSVVDEAGGRHAARAGDRLSRGVELVDGRRVAARVVLALLNRVAVGQERELVGAIEVASLGRVAVGVERELAPCVPPRARGGRTGRVVEKAIDDVAVGVELRLDRRDPARSRRMAGLFWRSSQTDSTIRPASSNVCVMWAYPWSAGVTAPSGPSTSARTQSPRASRVYSYPEAPASSVRGWSKMLK